MSLYIDERCPALKNGLDAAKELARFHHAYAGRTIEELPAVAREYAESEALRLKPATVRNRLAYLRAACRYAYRFHNMGESDPSERMTMPTVRNERHHYASRAEMLAIAKAMPVGVSRAILRIGFYSGMRLSEIIEASLLGNEAFLLTDTKNGERRIVPVHPRIRCCLRYYPVEFKKRWIQRQYSEAAKTAGFKHLHFHDMRHSAASEMINQGATLHEVGAVLGHKDARSTKRYAHLATDTLATAVGLIGRKSRTGQK